MRTRFVNMEPNRGDRFPLYWKWKTLLIDFSKYPDHRNPNWSFGWKQNEKRFETDGYKLDFAFQYVSIPDEKEHSWKNGDYSSEYNRSLNYLLDLGLIEIIEDGYDSEETE